MLFLLFTILTFAQGHCVITGKVDQLKDGRKLFLVYNNAWIGTIKGDGLLWTQVSDLKGSDSYAAEIYGINAIPASFLLDPEGRIIVRKPKGGRFTRYAKKDLYRPIESVRTR